MGEEKETEEEKSIDKASHLGSSGLRVGDNKKEALHLEEGKSDKLEKQRIVARVSHEQGTSPAMEENMIGGTRGKQKTEAELIDARAQLLEKAHEVTVLKEELRYKQEKMKELEDNLKNLLNQPK